MSAVLNSILALKPGIHGDPSHAASTSTQVGSAPPGPDPSVGGRPTYSFIASKSSSLLHPQPPRLTISKPLDTETVLRSVCSEMRDKERRRRNVIVSGLEPDEQYNDATMFGNICDAYLDIDISTEISLALTRRLPSTKSIKPLLVVFKKEETAVEVLRRARSLRDANSPRVESVYINADLTPTETKLAFEERVRRRARGNKSQPPRKGASAMDVVEDTDAGTIVTGGSSAVVESHD